ncbi:MAG TPA: helix-turn-helix transcriptional regulator [Prolixibacteraceae bacterium]|nr:helix-turn-helix transcriptional regulator [Prolixibacteraceae bacterium]HPR61770.1 helix-turn-helix transcriptional regulator [Prolixibacteraceae bacterium]
MGKYSLNKLPTDVMHEVALNHRNLRKSKKMSQSELAERSGVSLGSIKRFERSGQISFESLLKLAHVMDRLNDFDSIFLKKETEIPENLFSDKMRNE